MDCPVLSTGPTEVKDSSQKSMTKFKMIKDSKLHSEGHQREDLLQIDHCFILVITPCSTLELMRPNNYKPKTWPWKLSDTKTGRVVSDPYPDDYSSLQKLL